MQQPAALRSLYRTLLRELPPRRIPSKSPLHASLRAQFQPQSQSQSQSQSQPQHQSQPQSQGHPIQKEPTIDTATARELASYLAAQRSYVALIERYNPGMGMAEDERVRLTARRVGMDLPVEFDLGA